jgi:hypothetical protein
MTLPGRDEIEIYTTGEGLICLSQPDPASHEDSVVCFLPSDIPQVVGLLQQLAKELGAK